MKKLLLPILSVMLLMTSCFKNNPKTMSKDLYKGGKWTISSFYMVQYENPSGWAGQEIIVTDSLMTSCGTMEFLDEEGQTGSTYRKGIFQINGENPVDFDWDAYGPPSSEEWPDMYIVFSQTWGQFQKDWEYSGIVTAWEENDMVFDYRFGMVGGGGPEWIYSIHIAN